MISQDGCGVIKASSYRARPIYMRASALPCLTPTYTSLKLELLLNELSPTTTYNTNHDSSRRAPPPYPPVLHALGEAFYTYIVEEGTGPVNMELWNCVRENMGELDRGIGGGAGGR